MTPPTKTVASVAPYPGPVREDGLVEVFDLTVPGPHAYAAGGVVVGNSKRLSLLDTTALLAHGAYETVRDALLHRGQQNDDWWLAFLQGHAPPDPQVPFAYKKFVNSLRASGVNVVGDGPRARLLALTDTDVDALAEGRVVTASEAVRDVRGELRPVPGGLFDPEATGGFGGTAWSAVKLHEPMPNPAFEAPIKALLGLSTPKFEKVLAGEESLPGGRTGPAGLKDALAGLDVKRELALARQEFADRTGAGRDAAARRIGYLKTLDRLKMSPADWVLGKVPVLPPAFRPVSRLPDGTPVVADANYLYLELLEADRNLRELHAAGGEKAAGPERLAVYRAFQAVTGLGDPQQRELRDKGVRGLLAQVFGDSPKYGSVQRSLLSSTVDNVARGVAVPDGELDMDSVGVPEEAAFTAYGRYVARRLVRQGLPVRQALKEVKGRTDRAREALVDEMDARPVLVNRAPVLHKFGVMAFRPRLTPDSTIRVSPLVFKGFGLDADGDQMNLHVPASEEAVREAYDRLLPSRNLFHPASMTSPIHQFGQDYLAGLDQATAPPAGRPGKAVRDAAELLAAFRRGELGLADPVLLTGDDDPDKEERR